MIWEEKQLVENNINVGKLLIPNITTDKIKEIYVKVYSPTFVRFVVKTKNKKRVTKKLNINETYLENNYEKIKNELIQWILQKNL